MAKADQFVKYHVKQGLILFIAEVVVWFLGMFFFPSYFLWMLLRLVDLIGIPSSPSSASSTPPKAKRKSSSVIVAAIGQALQVLELIAELVRLGSFDPS